MGQKKRTKKPASEMQDDHGSYTFESRIHKVAVEFPNIFEGLVGVQLCVLFLLQISSVTFLQLHFMGDGEAQLHS